MASLVEVHTEPELETALEAGARDIGVNNRDLHTFETTLETTERLGPPAKATGCVLVSESGIHTPEHVARVARAGADAILVGEAIVCSVDVGARVRDLAGVTAGGNRE
jgi:indole-3-glycerol phosphate synthase